LQFSFIHVQHTSEGMGIPFTSSDIHMSDDDREYQVCRPPSCYTIPSAQFPDQTPSQSDTDSVDMSTSSRAVAQARSPLPCPCAILQAFACSHGYGSGSQSSPTVIGDAELSQLVFMHREAFLANPSAHAGCSASFKGLASILEKRVQLTDGDVGMQAVGMLRSEAWLLSGWSA
jgi:hypothetical protein